MMLLQVQTQFPAAEPPAQTRRFRLSRGSVRLHAPPSTRIRYERSQLVASGASARCRSLRCSWAWARLICDTQQPPPPHEAHAAARLEATSLPITLPSVTVDR
eukprot:1935681-Rhodomonas_salina.1